MRVGFLGPQGTFSEQAAQLYTRDVPGVELQMYHTIPQVVDAVQAGELDEGVIPFENSIEGTVTSAIDTLIFHAELYIKAEVVIAVEQCLLGRGPRPERVERILSHPQALAQCREFLHRRYPDAEQIPVSSTAEAARLVAAGEPYALAIAPRRAADVYGLTMWEQGIEDDHSNQTRFVVVTRTPSPVTAQKTSLAFSTDNRPGELYRVLDIFCIWNVNMTKIESRPSKIKLGTYVFFVDLETENAQDMEDALKMVARKTTFFKYLGSYPVYSAKG